MQAGSRTEVILLVGATAVGKTAISIQLAERIHAEIISADSRLFYRGMDIGTAKPSPEERARVPHHLIDIADPDQTVSLAMFQSLVRSAVDGIRSRDRVPMLVGGTGQYMRAVTSGWQVPRVEPNERLRAELQEMTTRRGATWMHASLSRLDRDAAALIDARNARRVVRAMEVILTTGRRFSEQRVHSQSPYRLVTLGLRRSRSDVYARIDARIEDMFNRGLLSETRRLLAQGYRPDLPSMSAIGYAQCVRVIHGELDLEQAKAATRRATRGFVRRQANWFKESDPKIAWFDAADQGIVDAMGIHVSQALTNP
jgi:tRNA dimethylallyltransferase